MPDHLCMLRERELYLSWLFFLFFFQLPIESEEEYREALKVSVRVLCASRYFLSIQYKRQVKGTGNKSNQMSNSVIGMS